MVDKETLIEIILTKRIWKWPLFSCSRCGYQAGFIFNLYDLSSVVYDRGCNCYYKNNRRPSCWEEVVNRFNEEDNPIIKNQYFEYWGLKKAS